MDWQEWLRGQVEKPGQLPLRMRQMIALYGPGPEGAKCKTCIHFVRLHYAKTYFKCDLTKTTAGPGTDWRAKWPACGKYYAGKGKSYSGR